MPGQNRIDFQVGFKADTSGIEKAKQALASIGDLRINSFGGTKEELMKIQDTANTVHKVLSDAFNVKLDSINTDKFNQGLKNAGLSIQDIYSKLSAVGPQGQQAFNELATSVLTSNLHLKETNSIINNMGTTMMNTVKWGITSSIMNTFTSSVQQAFQYVKSLDSALNDIRIVTGNSSEQMAKFAEQANRAASGLGRSTMDYTKAALTFYQQGLDEESVQARAETVLKAQNITGAGSEMSDYLTAVWNGYKVANEEAELYVDKLAAVADSSASNMSQLAIAMSKVASTANTMGVDVDQLNAQIATIVATTRQAPQSVGNALKTIYTRINDISTGAEGAEISLGTYSSRLAQMGINVLDSNNELRDTGEVIEEIGSKWETFSREQQVSIARTMAGQRQINNMTALFDNWDKYIDLVNVSLESQGTTMEKNSIYMDSLAAHMQQLGTAGERVKSALIDTDSFKGLIDIATGLTQGFAHFIEGLGGGGNALLAFGSIATNVFSGVISKEITKMITNTENARNNFKQLQADIEFTQKASRLDYNSDDILSKNAVQAVVKAKEQIQQYYGIMQAGEINAYNNIVKRIGELQTDLDIKKQQLEVVKALAQQENEMGGFGRNHDLTFEDWKNSLGEIQQRLSHMSLGQLPNQMTFFRNAIQELKSGLGEEGFKQLGGDEVIKSLVAMKQAVDDNGEAARAAKQKFEQFLEKVKDSEGPDAEKRMREEIEAQTEAINRAKQAAAEYVQQFRKMSNVDTIIKSVSGIGALASGLNTTLNLYKNWTDQTRSIGDNLLQTFMTAPMVFAQGKRGLTQLGKVAVKVFGDMTLANGATVTQLAQKTKELGSLTGAFNALGISISSVAIPLAAIIVSIGALVALGKYFDKITITVEEAKEALEKFNAQQQELLKTTQEYDGKIAKLEEVREEYEALAEKAGADNYDATIDNLTQAERQRYIEIKNLFAEYNSSVVRGYETEKGVILEKNAAIQQSIKLIEQEKKARIDAVYSGENFKTASESAKTLYENQKQTVKELTRSSFVKDLDQDTSSAYQTLVSNFSEQISNYDFEFSFLTTMLQDQVTSYIDKSEAVALQNLEQMIYALQEGKKFNKPAFVEGGLEQLESIDEGINQQRLKEKIGQLKGIYQAWRQSYTSQIDQELQKQIQEETDKLNELDKIDASMVLGNLQSIDHDYIYQQTMAAYKGNTEVILNEINQIIQSARYSQGDTIQSVATEIAEMLQQRYLNQDSAISNELLTDIKAGITRKFGENFKNLKDKSLTDIQTDLQNYINEILDGTEELKDFAQNNPNSFQNLINSLFSIEGITFTYDNENGIQAQTQRITDDINKINNAIAQNSDNKIRIPIKLDETEIDEYLSGLKAEELTKIESYLPQINWSLLTKEDIESGQAFHKFIKESIELLKESDNLDTLGLFQRFANGENLSAQQLQSLKENLKEVIFTYPELQTAVNLLNKQWLRGTDAYSKALDEIQQKQFELIKNQLDSGNITQAEANQKAMPILTNLDALEQARSQGILSETGETQALVKIGSGYDNLTEEVKAVTDAYAAYEQAVASGNGSAVRQIAITLEAANAALEAKIALNEEAAALGFTTEEVDKTIAMLQAFNPELYNNAEAVQKAALQYLSFNKAFAEFKQLGNSDDKNKGLMADKFIELFETNQGTKVSDSLKEKIRTWFADATNDPVIYDMITQEGEELQATLEQVFSSIGLPIHSKTFAQNLVDMISSGLNAAKEEISQQSSLQLALGNIGLSSEDAKSVSDSLQGLLTTYPGLRQQVALLNATQLEGTATYQAALEQLKRVLFSVYASQQGENEVGKFSEQVKTLITNTEDLEAATSMKLLTDADYIQTLMQIASQYENCTREMDSYLRALAWGDEQQIHNATSNLQLATRAGQMAEQYGLSANEIERAAKWLAETNPLLELNSELATDAAVRYLRLNDGVESLAKNADKYRESLSNSGGVLVDFDQLDNIKEDVADVFDTMPDLFSDDWVANNLDKILSVVESGGEGFEELQSLASQEILLNAGIDFEQFGVDTDSLLATIADLEEGQMIDLEADIQTAGMIQKMIDLMTLAGMSASEIESFFSGLGLDIDTEPAQQSIEDLANSYGMIPEAAGDAAAEGGMDVQQTTELASNPYRSLVPDVEYDIQDEYGSIMYPIISYPPVGGNVLANMFGQMTVKPGRLTVSYPEYKPTVNQTPAEGEEQTSATALKLKAAGKSSGGKFSHTNRKRRGGGGGSRGGGGGGGGKGSAPKPPKQAKTVQLTDLTKGQKPLQPDKDPYHEINLDLKRQGKLLDDIADKEKKTITRDRIDILNEQIEALKEENKLLDKKNNIANKELVRQRNQLEADFGKNFVQYDQEGYVANFDKISAKSAKIHNDNLKKIQADLTKVEKEYNDWIKNVYNKAASEEQQEKLYKAEKERRDEALKQAQEDAKQKQKDEADYHKQRMANLKEYEETIKLQEEIAKQKAENQEKMYQQRIARSKVRVQLGLDTGEAERDWLEFEKKFIKKIKTDDIIGNAKYTIAEINSYIDSEQIQRTKDRIDALRTIISNMESGAKSSIYGTNIAQAKEDLQTLMKQLRDDLMKIQDLQQQMRDYYLDSIDQAKDKFADHVDQYNRINDLIKHNIQLTELLYGDKAYDTLGKYYDMQYDNNIKTISMLKQQADYWKQLMEGEQQNSEAWKRFKQNWEQATDNINSMLEETIDLLSTRFENALNKAIENTNNKLTNGLGVDYLDQQWDAINNYDDTFLDTVNSKFGIEEVERLYQNASNELMGNPKQQQRINNLMNEQLKILREKDKLTQYDIDRAKALLEVEQARMALEDARNAKTKMRLRRDRQGNYTYQYVADEEKLEDLQSALAQAQSNLYNQDKEHYKQNLDQLYQTYKNYIEQMKELTEAYNIAQSTKNEEEMARIQKRIDLVKSTTAQLMEGLTEDNKYAMRYLTQSTFDSLEIDPSIYTAAEQLEIVRQNVPQVNSEIQSLADNIVGEGGILNATAAMINEFTKATKEYGAAVKEVLEGGGTSLDTIANVVDENNKALDSNITAAQKLLEVNEKLIESCKDQVAQMQVLLKVLDQYMQNMINTSSLVGSLASGQNLLQQLNGGIISNVSKNARTVVEDRNSSAAFSGNSKQDTRTIKQKIQNVLQDYQDFLNSMSGASFNTGGFTGVWNDVDGRMAILHEKELVLNQEDTANILAAVRSVREMTSLLNMQSEFSDLQTNMSAVMSTAARSGLLDQNVHIEANFPNVTQHTEIEQAFNNLVNMASMHASKPRSAL